MHVLEPVLRDYAWGSTDDLPRLLRREPTGGPVAEAWWGAHDTDPSHADTENGKAPLDELIAREPHRYIGEAAHQRWGARLPYLLKVLAIAKPLSIQVHPTMDQAREGFEREQRGTGGAPHSFLDPYHKPEMVMAFTPMVVLAGVRPIADLVADLRALETPFAEALAGLAEGAGDVRAYIEEVLTGADATDTLDALARRGAQAPEFSSMRVAADALGHFPGDRGALVALALNVVTLEPGEAVFTGAGVLHSYQSGVGLEIMANSDNVVRAGLTPKAVDVPLMLTLADTVPSAPVRPAVVGDAAVRHLACPVEEFGLTVVSDAQTVVEAGPRIVLTLRGSTTIEAGGNVLTLDEGSAAFVRDCDGEAVVRADGHAVVARLP